MTDLDLSIKSTSTPIKIENLEIHSSNINIQSSMVPIKIESLNVHCLDLEIKSSPTPFKIENLGIRLPGLDGRKIELQKGLTHIQWHYLGDEGWIDLISLSELKGDPYLDGKVLEFDWKGTQLGIRNDEENEFQYVDLKGDVGNGISNIIRTDGEGIQGTSDTYTITYTDGTTNTFSVYNGANAAITEQAIIDALGYIPLQSVPNIYRTSADQNLIDVTKVDKVEGKGLSTNDYTDEDKAKATETYIHEQQVASKRWVISHPLEKFPSVTVIDTAGTVVVGDVEYVLNSLIIITFSAEFSGKVFLN